MLFRSTWSKAGWGISVDGYVQKDYVTKQPVVASSVIIQFVEQYDSKYGDRFGGKTPLVKTIGSGNAFVLRNGNSYEAQWSRPAKDSGTSFTIGGAPLPFDVGQVMILLVNAQAKKGSVVIE